MQSAAPDSFFRLACWFEGALILVALLVGWLTDIDPFAELNFAELALFNGALLTLPLLLLFCVLQQLPFPSLRHIRELLLETLGSKLHERHWTDLLILACIAGFSEELLFRGTLQPWLEHKTSPATGLLLSNAMFALAHAITPLYAVLAMLMGIYLGMSLDYSGERQLLTPIAIHTFYDFFAFLIIMRDYRRSL